MTASAMETEKAIAGATPAGLSADRSSIAPWRHVAVSSWADFWLRTMFWCLHQCPLVLRAAKPFFISAAWRSSRHLRTNLRLNAGRLLGSSSTPADRDRLARKMLSNFYEFLLDLGRTRGMTDSELLAQIAEVEGRDRYTAMRQSRSGAILVTAHLGPFETGLAALRQEEPRIHVVFRRDRWPGFESLRSQHRRRLGVIEAPIDDGLEVWIKLRDALRNNEVVLLQGDRVTRDQRGQRVPFLGGHMMLPTGPIKLALASGAPIMPIFTLRRPDGRVRIVLEEPIIVDPLAADASAPHPAMLLLASVIARYVRQHPDQWLSVHRAWCEDT